jgi:hypothetical protein
MRILSDAESDESSLRRRSEQGIGVYDRIATGKGLTQFALKVPEESGQRFNDKHKSSLMYTTIPQRRNSLQCTG